MQAEPECGWAISELVKRWQPFAAAGNAATIDVRIHGLPPQAAFDWTKDQHRPFINLFRLASDRYPFEKGNNSFSHSPAEILSRLDPENETIKYISQRLVAKAEIVLASTASGLLVFDPGEKRLHIYSPAVSRPLPLISRISKKYATRAASFFSDITNGIMLAVSRLLIEEGGLLLHGTGLGRSGKAVLFLGLSGAGKSTVARRCPSDACFSDDGVIIKKPKAAFFCCHRSSCSPRVIGATPCRAQQSLVDCYC